MLVILSLKIPRIVSCGDFVYFLASMIFKASSKLISLPLYSLGYGIVVFAPFDIRAVTAVVQSDIGFVFGMLAENRADRAFRRAGQNGFGSFQRDVENSVCAG